MNCEHKIAVVGEPGVGKRTYITRLIEGEFNSRYSEGTISGVKLYASSSMDVDVPKYDGVIFMVDVTKESNSIDEFIQLSRKCRYSVLVFHKADGEFGPSPEPSQKIVQCARCGFDKLFEVSSKNMYQMEKPIEAIIGREIH